MFSIHPLIQETTDLFMADSPVQLPPFSLLPPPPVQVAIARQTLYMHGMHTLPSMQNLFDRSADQVGANRPDFNCTDLPQHQAWILDCRPYKGEKVGLTLQMLWDTLCIRHHGSGRSLNNPLTDFLSTQSARHELSDIEWVLVDFGSCSDEKSVDQLRQSGRRMPSTALFWAVIYNPILLPQLNATLNFDSLWLGGASHASNPGSQGEEHVVYLAAHNMHSVHLARGYVRHIAREICIPTIIS